MFKKLFVVALLVAAGVVAFKKFDFKCCRKDKSLEAQITEQEQVLASLNDEIKQHLHQIAVREVDVKYLREEIKEVEARQVENKKVLQARRDGLKGDAGLVTVADRSDPARKRAEKEFARLLDAYKNCEAEVKAKKAKLEALEDALAASKDEVSAYQNERREQEVELNKLKALVAQMRVEEIKSKVHFDKSKLAQVKKNTAALRKKIEVRQKELELQGQYLGKAAHTEEKERDVLKEADDLFGAERK